MSNVIRVALPDYNALTDTNPDHFALYSDEDWVLIKEKARGSFTLAGGGSTQTIAHNLGYIPFFLVYVLDTVDSKWRLVPNYQGAFSVPDYAAYADTTNVYVVNELTSTDFKYYIFYDNVVGSVANDIDLGGQVLSVAKAGIDALAETDPNNFIFHSNFNTLKILKEGTGNITYSGNGNYTVAHGLSSYTATSILVFIKFPDGFVALVPGRGACVSKDRKWSASKSYVDATNINVYLSRISGSDTALSIKYYIFETPLV